MYPNKIRISNGEGQVSITAISRAFEVGQVAEDFDLSKYTSVEHLLLQIEKVINDYKLKYD